MRFLSRVLFFVVCLALLIGAGLLSTTLSGCGDDNPSSTITPGDDDDDLFSDIRPGTWSASATLTLTGGDAFCSLATPILDIPDAVLCSGGELTVGNFGDGCSLAFDGDEFTLDCLQEDVDDDGCVATAVLTGTGTVTQTTYSFSGSITSTLSGEGNCPTLTCTWDIDMGGQWESDDGAETCPEAAGSLATWIANSARESLR